MEFVGVSLPCYNIGASPVENEEEVLLRLQLCSTLFHLTFVQPAIRFINNHSRSFIGHRGTFNSSLLQALDKAKDWSRFMTLHTTSVFILTTDWSYSSF